MRNAPTPLRPAMTALAAAIALSATAAFAQATDPAAVPVIVGPPPPSIAPAPAESVAAPSVAAPTVAAPAPAAAAPSFTGATRSTPIYHQPEPADVRAEEAARPAAPVRRTTTTTRTATVERAAPAVAAAAVTAPAQPAPVAAPRTATPAPAAPAAPLDAAPVTADATGPVAAPRATGVDPDVLPVAGAGAAALLLIGGGVALLRRRRRDDEVAQDEYVLTEETSPTIAPALAATAPIAAVPVMARAAEPRESSLPGGFDLSRYGRHIQAAYRGPTAENPSQMLRKRLKRASFLDGRERIAAEAGAPMPVAAAARTAPAAARDDGQIVVRPQAAKPRDLFRAAFSS